MIKSIAILVILSILSGCSQESILGCEAVGKKQPFCGTRKPEDLVLLPDKQTLLVSEMGDWIDNTKPGAISAFNTRTGKFQRLFPLPIHDHTIKKIWADPNCPGLLELPFAPHGIAVSNRPNGRLQLLTVNHGSREAIEYFEILQSETGLKLVWRGCAIPPDGSFMNDVVALSNGGFVATHMFDRNANNILEMIKVMLGVDTGHIIQWQPKKGYEIIPNSQGPFVNGIEISADESTLFVNYYGANEVRKIERLTGKILASAQVQAPDNITWSDSGNLLVASHTGSFTSQLSCGGVVDGGCTFAFKIVEIHPADMTTSVLVSHQGAPMGGATVARQVGNKLYLGSYGGDRIMAMPLP